MYCPGVNSSTVKRLATGCRIRVQFSVGTPLIDHTRISFSILPAAYAVAAVVSSGDRGEKLTQA